MFNNDAVRLEINEFFFERRRARALLFSDGQVTPQYPYFYTYHNSYH